MPYQYTVSCQKESENVARIVHKTNRVIYDSVSLTIRVQSLKFPKIRKFVPLIIFICETIFHVIRVLNFYIGQKRCPLFMKKVLVAITSVSLKIKHKSRKWQLLPAPGAPGLKNNVSFLS